MQPEYHWPRPNLFHQVDIKTEREDALVLQEIQPKLPYIHNPFYHDGTTLGYTVMAWPLGL